MNSAKERDYAVDIIKTLGTLLIVLSHVWPSKMLGFRSVAPCIMVFASGMTFRYQGSTSKDYIRYVYKKFRRLVMPTWVFVVIYYTISAFGAQFSEGWAFSRKDIILSFLMIGGLKQLWFVRVIVILAILAPVLSIIAHSAFFEKYWGVVIPILLFMNEIFAFGCEMSSAPELVKGFFKGLVVYTIGYGVLYILPQLLNNENRWKLTLLCAFLFLAVWVIEGFTAPDDYKYPPQALYILYGSSVSLLLYNILRKRLLGERMINKAVVWISSNSLWIYFWHMVALTWFDSLEGNKNLVVEYLGITVFAFAITGFQNRIVSAVRNIERSCHENREKV